MIYLAYIVLVFATLQLVVALSNLLFRQRLRPSADDFTGLVSVLVPARNEEATIGVLLSDLLKQDYPNIEIIVFNDQSDDRTEEIVARFAASDRRISLINSAGLPDGWLGKNHGCHTLAQHAKGEFLLFLDADVRVRGAVLGHSAAFARSHGLGLLSIFPRQEMASLGERSTVPIMNYILLTLLPLVLVMKSRFASLSAANGQFMLFDAHTYRRSFPHEKYRANRVEDIEIARFFKQDGIAVACLAGDGGISCRMYRGFGQAVEGFAKNVIHFFGNSYCIAFVFWLLTTLGFIPVFVSFGGETVLIYIAAVISTRLVVSAISRQSLWWNSILILPQQIALGMFMITSFVNTHKNSHQWKGRSIS